MKNIKLHPRNFFEDVHVFNTFQIYIFNLTEDTLGNFQNNMEEQNWEHHCLSYWEQLEEHNP